MNKCETLVEWCRHNKTKVPTEKPVPVPLAQPHILLGLAWNRTQASTLTAGNQLPEPCHDANILLSYSVFYIHMCRLSSSCELWITVQGSENSYWAMWNNHYLFQCDILCDAHIWLVWSIQSLLSMQALWFCKTNTKRSVFSLHS